MMPAETGPSVNKRRYGRARVWWSVGIVVVLTLAGLLFWPSYQERLLNREIISGVTMMKHVGVEVIRADDGENDLIDARRALLSNPEVMQVVFDHYRRWDREARQTLTIGGVSMERLLDDEQLRRATAAALPAPDTDWLAIGPLMICQRRDHYSGLPNSAAGISDLVIAYVANTALPDRWYVALADGSASLLDATGTIRDWGTLESDSAFREASGLPPLPMPKE